MKKGQWAIRSENRNGLLCQKGESYVVTDDFEDGGQFSGRVLLFDTEETAKLYLKGSNQKGFLYPIEFDYYLHF